MSQEFPSFDLVVATVGRTDELTRLLDSIDAQHYEPVRVIVVDQNEDPRVQEILSGRNRVERIGSERGLSRARNAALPLLRAEVVAFPDDDCSYPLGLLADLAARFARDPALDGIAGRTEDGLGDSSASWEKDAALLTLDNLWNRANAATIFLRRAVVERVGTFDEGLGLGSGQPWSSGEETDYLIRAVRDGARIEYDPAVVVRHAVRPDDARVGRRDGASVGYLLRKHRYPARVLVRMLVRPVGGAVLALGRLDRSRARYYWATVRGRVAGYRGASRSNSSA